MTRTLLAAVFGLAMLVARAGVAADPGTADFRPRTGDAISGDVPFADEAGRPVALASYLGHRPVLLVPVYYHCPNLCGATMDNLFAALDGLPADVRGYGIVAFSIDPHESPSVAAQQRGAYAARHPRVVRSNVHFLVDRNDASRRLAGELGLTYVFDAAADQFFHDSVIAVLTSQGTIAAYLSGLTVTSAELEQALDDARQGRITGWSGRIRFICHQLASAASGAGAVVVRALRWGGLALLLGLALAVGSLIRLRRPGIRRP